MYFVDYSDAWATMCLDYLCPMLAIWFTAFLYVALCCRYPRWSLGWLLLLCDTSPSGLGLAHLYSRALFTTIVHPMCLAYKKSMLLYAAMFLGGLSRGNS